MTQIDNKAFYKKAIDEYGVSAQGVHWNSKHTQYKRFEILTKFIKKDIVNSSIVDVGCGFGEYYKYLETNNKQPQHYLGVDCEEEMIDICKKRLPLLEFKKQDILTDTLIEADYYICSGALNLLLEDEILVFIEKCFEVSKKGFIFNFLKEDSFNKLKVDKVLGYCHFLTPNVKTKDDYLSNDFTVFMEKL